MSFSFELSIEIATACKELRKSDIDLLVGELRIPREIITDQLIGRTRVRRCAESLYEPDPDGNSFAYVTPVRLHYAETPESCDPERAVRCGEIIDIIAWHPEYPTRWALRTGLATWAGAIQPQYLRPERVRFWRTPLRWLQEGCIGIVLLSSERSDHYRILTHCVGGIVPENELHSAELKRSLQCPYAMPEVRCGH